MHTVEDLRSGRLHGAKHLKLRSLSGEFPKEIFDLADTLEILDLNGNGLSALPDDLPRLTQLKTLFCSDNPFTYLPEVLSDCPALDMIGFKSCQLTTIPSDALSERVRWFIVTGNAIDHLPERMGDLSRLQKCMLAGNQLSSLPDSMQNCQSLELLRLSANRFERLPDFLFDLPRLSWLTFAGNPLHEPFIAQTNLPTVSMAAIELHHTLGEGASGIISMAKWTDAAPTELASQDDIAFKEYKGAVTSDGFANDELAASIAAGQNDHLVSVIAQTSAPDPTGLIMSLIPEDYENLGLPPTLESCTRDVYRDDLILSLETALAILQGIADAMVHLRDRNICHNDLYAHNILIRRDGHALLTDFGAAANYASLPTKHQSGLERLEVRAFGCLVEDMIELIDAVERSDPRYQKLVGIKQTCMTEMPSKRPDFSTIYRELQNA